MKIDIDKLIYESGAWTLNEEFEELVIIVQRLADMISERVVEFRSDEHNLYYRWTGSEEWVKLINLDSITGPMGPIGPVGKQGPRGFQGDTGPIGPQGPRGPRGETPVVTVHKGIIYVDGKELIPSDEIRGPKGDKGDKGDTGEVGPRGPQGEKGSTGATGAVGPQGPQGEQGPIGPQGPRGLKGEKGDIGPQGPQGERGPKGEKGDEANTTELQKEVDNKVSLTGDETIRGVKTFNDTIVLPGRNTAIELGNKNNWFWTKFTGENWTFNNTYTSGGWARNLMEMKNANDEAYFRIGAQGGGQSFSKFYIGEAYNRTWIEANKNEWNFRVQPKHNGVNLATEDDIKAIELKEGPKGDTGPAGPKGDIGPQGPKGDTGARGATGPQGPKGDTGDRGPQGLRGATGAKGDRGDTGPQGIQGPKGLDGKDGKDGARGPQGIQGPEGPQGPKGDVGPEGPQGPQGIQGEKGPQGDRGPEGPKGDDAPAKVHFDNSVTESTRPDYFEDGITITNVSLGTAFPKLGFGTVSTFKPPFTARASQFFVGEDGTTITRRGRTSTAWNEWNDGSEKPSEPKMVYEENMQYYSSFRVSFKEGKKYFITLEVDRRVHTSPVFYINDIFGVPSYIEFRRDGLFRATIENAYSLNNFKFDYTPLDQNASGIPLYLKVWEVE